jgi:hypothetical protein|tara:strand:- start:989 stop:1636 length:648 start_codon:yes stop_codon:yes gene_type:complete
MTLTIRPELGVPLGEEESVLDLKDRTEAASNTALELAEHGLDIEPTKEDKDIASKLAVAYAADPEKVSKKASSKKVSKLTPASLILTNQILQEFGHSVAESATQIRHLVTNKLLIESENADPRIRVRALELLGKISDVGLFSEKSEVTITHQSTDDLREKLRSKLEKLVNPVDDIEEAEFMDAEPIDVDEELGMPDEEEEVEEEYDDEEECPSQP